MTLRTLAAKSESRQGTAGTALTNPTTRILVTVSALSVGSFPRRGCLPGAARSLHARLQVCDLRLVLTVGVLCWFLLNGGLLSRPTGHLFLHVGFLGLRFLNFWVEG